MHYTNELVVSLLLRITLKGYMYANIHDRILMKYLFIKVFRSGYILNR